MLIVEENSFICIEDILKVYKWNDFNPYAVIQNMFLNTGQIVDYSLKTIKYNSIF